ncbi:hypothetical protein B0H67DRAFT_638570 [Lasiosphaeris hirsuta]|uniref:Uncharacterized protein n=1 Tax=Lasiosphaeris hirsuta TaxID=260670 RepID=A0AA40B9D3_9PEZI|nr:hypothetical protein B0H67DRAFT_638570 [Lasiosphaeris hirsuta]
MTAPSIEDETPGIAAAQPEDSSRDHHFGFRPRRLPSNGGSTDPLHQQAQDPFLPSYPALATYEALLPGTDTFPFIPLQVFGEDTGDVGTCLETSMLVESRSDYS